MNPRPPPPGDRLRGHHPTLNAERVDYIIVGGFAAAALGSARVTYDLDLVYSRSEVDLGRVVAALEDLSPYLRGAPPGLPFRLDEVTLRRGLNFTLTTSLGPLDLLGEIAGGGGYVDLLPHTIEAGLFGHPCRCLGSTSSSM